MGVVNRHWNRYPIGATTPYQGISDDSGSAIGVITEDHEFVDADGDPIAVRALVLVVSGNILVEFEDGSELPAALPVVVASNHHLIWGPMAITKLLYSGGSGHTADTLCGLI